MSLSLEVKRFINSEHVGEFVTVVLPGELPVDRAEVREVNRANAAAQNAEAAALRCSDEAEKAANRVEETKRQIAETEIELKDTEDALNKQLEIEKGHRAKADALKLEADGAHSEFLTQESKYDKKNEAFLKAEEKYKEAESALEKKEEELSQKLIVSQNAAKKSGDAVINEATSRQELEAARSQAAKTQTLADSAAKEAETCAQAAEEKRKAHSELTREKLDLSVEIKTADRRIQDEEKTVQRLEKEYSKAKLDYESVSQQYSLAQNALKSKAKGAEREAAKNRSAALKLKTDTAQLKMNDAGSRRDARQEKLDELRGSRARLETRYNETDEKLLLAEKSLAEAVSAAAAANERSLEEKARLASAAEALTLAQSRMEKAAGEITSSADRAVETETEAAGAQLAAKRAKEEAASAAELFEKAKAEMETARAPMEAAKAAYDEAKDRYDEAHAELEKAENESAAARLKNSECAERLEALKARLLSDTALRERAEEAQRAAEEEALRLGSEVRTVETKHETAKIHYMESGEGEPLILVHSVGQSLYTFRNIFHKLASGYRVIALDLAGHGYSDRPYIFEYSAGDHAECIIRFMDAMGIESAHFFGFSMGAGYVLELARRHPERVGRLVLECPGGVTGAMPLSIRMLGSGLLGGIASRLYNMRTVDKLLSECVFDHTVIDDTVIEEYYRPACGSEARRAIRESVYNYDEEAIIKGLRDIKAGALIIWSDEDRWHPMEMGELYNAALKDSVHTLVRNAGHLAHEEKPDKIASLVRQFIPTDFEQPIEF